MINAFWWTSEQQQTNWGDIIAPIIIEFLSEQKSCCRLDGGRLLTVGSILTLMNDNDIVWGSGLIVPKLDRKYNNVRFCAVRGPLTRNVLIQEGYDVPEIYGDPGILMPKIIPIRNKISKTRPIGIIPHYSDREHTIQNLISNRVNVIDIMSGVENVMNEVSKCSVIISSSLHGVILAEAWKKKTIYAIMGNRLYGGDFKFKDYYLGSGDRKVTPVDFTGKITDDVLDDAIEMANKVSKPIYDFKKLIMSFPYLSNERREKYAQK